jgi:hypothetical protein
MAEQDTENKNTKTKKTRRGLRRWAGIALLAAAAVLALLWLTERLTVASAEQRLAAIEAARAIPDEENAAVIYSEVLENRDSVSGQPDFLSMAGLRGPWLSADYPEAADWLQAHQSEIGKILEASRKQKCHFPIPVGTAAWTREMNLLPALRACAQLLVSAANNDVAEGRIDAALEKYRCVIQMGAHLQDQPVMIHFLVGIGLEAFGLTCQNMLIVEGNVTEGHLKAVEETLPELRNNWDRDWPQIYEIENLLESCRRKEIGYFRWLVQRFRHGISNVDSEERFKELYLRILAQRRGTHLLIALRRYTKANGHWPQSLEEVKSLAPPEVFIDPLNGGSFVYKLTEDDFVLYSKGKNNIDENGSRKGTADDWLIWPPRSRPTQTKQPAQ